MNFLLLNLVQYLLWIQIYNTSINHLLTHTKRIFLIIQVFDVKLLIGLLYVAFNNLWLSNNLRRMK